MPAPRIMDPLRMTAGFLAGLRAFSSQAPAPAASRARLARRVAARARSFLRVMERGIFNHSGSPYLPLLRHAGVEFGDIARLVDRDGVEGALAALYDAGVRVSLDEFKGRCAIRRGSLEHPAAAADFDNPLQAGHYETETGGSRSAGTRVVVDLELVAREADYELLMLEAFGVSDRPRALWRPAPPGVAGLKCVLRYAKVGRPMSRWFSQSRAIAGAHVRHAAFTLAAVTTGRIVGAAVPMPEFVPLAHADVVAAWLARHTAAGTPALLETNASSAVRVCLAAATSGRDIAGTFFRVGSEPYTEGKAAAIAAAGCHATSQYAMAEVGRIATSCADPDALDDVHVAIDKVAVLQRDVPMRGEHAGVGGLFVTTIDGHAPRLMLNVEVGDYAALSDRVCRCPLGTLGFTTHLHTIRSYEKLTSEGMHFLGTDLITLVEDTLPGRFGGGATDYQVIEQHEHGLPRVSLLVRPGVTSASDDEIRDVVVAELGRQGAAEAMMASLWREGRTIRIVRQPPQPTRAGKILALHVPRP